MNSFSSASLRESISRRSMQCITYFCYTATETFVYKYRFDFYFWLWLLTVDFYQNVISLMASLNNANWLSASSLNKACMFAPNFAAYSPDGKASFYWKDICSRYPRMDSIVKLTWQGALLLNKWTLKISTHIFYSQTDIAGCLWIQLEWLCV